jgi:subtilase family serine protease
LLSGLSPQQVTHAYGLDAIGFSSNGKAVQGNGTGQTIAIVVTSHDPYITSDLHTFDVTYNLPDPTLTQVNLAGNLTDDGWAGEESLDVEWAHAIAPGASIVVVEARSTNLSDMVAAVDAARRIPGVSVVSMSWGMSEFWGQTAYDGLFTTPAGHTGVTFVAASGDGGAWSGPEWPSSSPNVLAVGGTTLLVDGAGDYVAEGPWSSTGGGVSQFEPEPSYQYGVQATGGRTTPDVAFDANPATGVAVYSTAPSTGFGSWQTVGGTSLGAPAWAGVIAIVDQGRATIGLGPLDGPTQTLPALYSLPANALHPTATPNGAALVGDLATTTVTSATPAAAQQATQTPVAPATVPVTTSGGAHRGHGHRGHRKNRTHPALDVPTSSSARLHTSFALELLDAALGNMEAKKSLHRA